YSVFRRPGGPSGGIPPDPISNSAVKAPSAHGTAAKAAGESVAARSAKDRSRNTEYGDQKNLMIPPIPIPVFRAPYSDQSRHQNETKRRESLGAFFFLVAATVTMAGLDPATQPRAIASE